MGNGDFTYFSAICYLSAKHLVDSLGPQPGGLQHMPMGLVSANWGGTCLQNWTPNGGPAECGQTTGGAQGGNGDLYNAIVSTSILQLPVFLRYIMTK